MDNAKCRVPHTVTHSRAEEPGPLLRRARQLFGKKRCDVHKEVHPEKPAQPTTTLNIGPWTRSKPSQMKRGLQIFGILWDCLFMCLTSDDIIVCDLVTNILVLVEDTMKMISTESVNAEKRNADKWTTSLFKSPVFKAVDEVVITAEPLQHITEGLMNNPVFAAPVATLLKSEQYIIIKEEKFSHFIDKLLKSVLKLARSSRTNVFAEQKTACEHLCWGQEQHRTLLVDIFKIEQQLIWQAAKTNDKRRQ